MRISAAIRTQRGRLVFGNVGAVLKQFNRYVRPHWRSLTMALVATFGAVVMQVAGPWPIKLVFDVVLSEAMAGTTIGRWFSAHAPDPTMALMIVCGAILLIAVAGAGFVYLRDVMLAQIGQNVVGKVRHDLFRHMQRLSPDVFERRRTGDLLMRLTGDIQMLRQMIVNAWITAAENVLTAMGVVAFMFWLNPLLAMIALATVLFVVWWTARLSKGIRKATKDQRERESFVASIAQEVIGGLPVIQAFNREKIEQQRFARQNRSSIRAGVRTTRIESRLQGIASLAAAAGLCAVLFLGVRSVMTDAMTVGDLLLFVAYMRSVGKPLRKLSKLAGQTAKATACGMRVAEILKIPPTITDRPDAVEAGDLAGRIELDAVDFAYPDGTRALSGCTLSIEPGECVAIVGESGAGKSTLVKLLLRFYDPSSGAIRIDGLDIRQFTVASLRRRIGVVQQEAVLFGLTVEENIALGDEGADRSAVRRVAEAVDAHHFIESLPSGYQTVLSERGTSLSGGQRQRIALARALLRGAPILVLDEPATGLDARTATVVEQSWMTGQKRQTRLVICHKLHAMERFDRIVMLSDGCIVGVGTHAELSTRCDAYMSLQSAWRNRVSESDNGPTGLNDLLSLPAGAL